MLCVFVLFLFLPLPALLSTSAKFTCGGSLTSRRGLLATPNFPHRFPTPIHCQWHIDAQFVRFEDETTPGASTANTTPPSIKIYFTQLYVQEGLTVTEYDSKDAYDYRLDGARVYTLTEDDATAGNRSYVVVRKEYAVVDFRLERIESTHLRVLDDLLAVYGFNVTYEIGAGAPRTDRCTMKLCGFTGYCYDDFTHFKCDCFPGFRGRRCSEGPKSKCVDGDARPVCENGGECLHTGHTAFVCDCKPGFEGTYCQHRTKTISSNDACDKDNDPQCLIACKFNGTMQDVCSCNNNKVSKNLQAINESIGYSSRIFIQSPLPAHELRETLKRNLLDTLKVNVSRIDDVNIIFTNTPHNETDVTLRFYAPKQHDELIRATIRKWGRQQYARQADKKNYTLTEKDILVRTEPYLFLEHIAIDKPGAISEGEEFVLSCTARGSRLMVFRWFMDDVLVNLTAATTHKWENLISKGRNTDHYTALLAVKRATRYDAGRYTCHVEDYGVQQCRSLRVAMIHQPQIRLEPASLTVDKGQPFRIKCISLAAFGEKYKFSWTKDKSLLPIKTEREHYEILYPSGSILQVAYLNKTTSYSCLAHLDKLSAEHAITVHVVDKQIVRPCALEHGSVDDGDGGWPETAPGGECRRACPSGYGGATTRACIMLENGEPRWLPPDHSNCTRLELMQPLRDFRYLEEGYAKTTPLQTVEHIERYARIHTLLRGEGRVLLGVVERVVAFNNASHGYSDHRQLTDAVLHVVDAILAQNVSLNKEQQVVMLQKLVRHQLMVLSAHLQQPYAKNLKNLQVSIEIDDNYLNPTRIVRITYRNLHEFLTKKSIVRLNYSDDREMKYEFFAGVTSIWRWRLQEQQPGENSNKIATIFNHHVGVGPFVGLSAAAAGNIEALTLASSHAASTADQQQQQLLLLERRQQQTFDARDGGVVRCVLAEYAASDYVWNAYRCHATYENASSVRCECDGDGTMAILLVDDAHATGSNRHSRFGNGVHDDLVLGACAASLAATVCATTLLTIGWCRHKSTMTFLNALCALAISGCMLLFILGFSDAISNRWYLNVLSGLLICYLTALSSQLSTLMIIYTDLIEMHRVASGRPTVAGVISGAPIIAVFANHLAHTVKDIPLAHWWCVSGTLAFYVAIVCVAIIWLLYVILCVLVSKLIKCDKTKSDKVLANRAKMMTRSCIVFVIVTLSAGASVACVNRPEEPLWRFAFAGTSIAMGAIVLICLICSVRTASSDGKHLFWKLRARRRHNDAAAAAGSAKMERDKERQVAHNKCDAATDLTLTIESPAIEEYNASPTQYSASASSASATTSAMVTKSTSLNSPDLLGTKVFVELDLVASSLQTAIASGVELTALSPQRFQHVMVVGGPNKTILKNGSKSDKCVTFCDTIEYQMAETAPAAGGSNDEEKKVGDIGETTGMRVVEGERNELDQVLDGISNDLKYLLNDRQYVDTINTISC